MAVSVVWTAAARAAELELPLPGAVVATSVTGEVRWSAGSENGPLREEDRLRVGAAVVTGRKSLLTLALSNGVILRLGSESELELEEFGQLPVAGSIKPMELAAEPTISRTRVRLVRGEVTIEVKPLQEARGSRFVLETPAGVLRTSAATVVARVRMSDLGLGISSVGVRKGRAEFAASGRQPVALMTGGEVTYALEADRRTGELKVGDMPAMPAAKR